ncbi:MAG: aldo/keto reductase [Nitriliruptorales bacterium]
MEYVEVQGERLPVVGFGTWELRGGTCYEAVRDALELGYRHIDTAQMYGNEGAVGRAIADSGVDREEILLTTKIPPRNLAPDDVRRSHEGSLRDLDVDRVDLLLIHWPSRSVPLEATLEAMRGLQEEGKTRHLGVSNFIPSLVEQSLEHAEILTNQVEFHPFLTQSHLVEQATEAGHAVTAYSPLAKGRVARDETLADIAEGHSKTPAQVALRWLVQQPNVITIPRSASAEHRAENLDVFDFTLTDDEIKRIGALNEEHRIIDPPSAPDWER